MNLSIAHICIGATDLAACEHFYCGVLGFRKVFRFVKKGRGIGMYLAVNDRSFIEIFQGADVKRDDASILRHFCLETDDIDGMYARLTAAGCEVSPKKLGADRSWQIWVTGPDGLRFEFHQYTPESSQRTGADCEVNW